MPLPPIYRLDRTEWKKLYDQAATNDGKAVVGAILLLTAAIDSLHDDLDSVRRVMEEIRDAKG